jgi:hypothetical protein
MAIAFQAERKNAAFRNGTLRKAARRDADLDDGALHFIAEARRSGEKPLKKYSAFSVPPRLRDECLI